MDELRTSTSGPNGICDLLRLSIAPVKQANQVTNGCGGGVRLCTGRGRDTQLAPQLVKRRGARAVIDV
jgi:hypothetical protein